MGEPVRIRDLAEQMIRFSGFEPETDIKIEYSGTRAGERLDERLWSQDEEPQETEYSRILRVDRKTPYCVNLTSLMEELKPICRFDPQRASMYRDSEILRAVLRSAIPSMCQVSDAVTR
jgi:FlaA1/EpsC-like NDP-sugar epimerase